MSAPWIFGYTQSLISVAYKRCEFCIFIPVSGPVRQYLGHWFYWPARSDRFHRSHRSCPADECVICRADCGHVACRHGLLLSWLKPGPHCTCQRCSGPVWDRPSASRPVPSRQNRLQAPLEAVLTGRNGPGCARMAPNRAGTALTGAVRTGLDMCRHLTPLCVSR